MEVLEGYEVCTYVDDSEWMAYIYSDGDGESFFNDHCSFSF